jgi:hypothetical protein
MHALCESLYRNTIIHQIEIARFAQARGAHYLSLAANDSSVAYLSIFYRHSLLLHRYWSRSFSSVAAHRTQTPRTWHTPGDMTRDSITPSPMPFANVVAPWNASDALTRASDLLQKNEFRRKIRQLTYERGILQRRIGRRTGI